VIIASLTCVTAPVSACDDRYAKKCEKAAAAEAAAANQAGSASTKRRMVRHVRLVGAHGRRTRMHPPGFAVKRAGGMALASDEARLTTLVPESALARRFRGFIDPQPIADNAFEALRKPHLVALNMEPAAAMPAGAIEAPETAAAAVADTTASIPAAAKQDRIAPLANAAQPPTVTRQAALTDALAAKPVAQVEATAAASQVPPAAPHAVAQAEMSAVGSAKPADQPGRFPVHKLVLALCGALGAASALRFIVRA